MIKIYISPFIWITVTLNVKLRKGFSVWLESELSESGVKMIN